MATDGILPELLPLACILEVYAIPTAKAFDRVLQNYRYWLNVDIKPLINKPPSNDGDGISFTNPFAPI